MSLLNVTGVDIFNGDIVILFSIYFNHNFKIKLLGPRTGKLTKGRGCLLKKWMELAVDLEKSIQRLVK